MPVFYLSNEIAFPSPHFARQDGLLAVGGDLSQSRLLLAYRMGIFPWYAEEDPIIWWSPDPRVVLYPGEIHIARSLRKVIRKKRFHVTADRAFEAVIRSCASVRMENGEGTWLVEEMIDAYCRLHQAGYAHSVETWQEGELVGGLYGVSLGGAFFGESMFMRTSNASKVALVALAGYADALKFDLIDCQMKTAHLMRFGAREIPRTRFLNELKQTLRRSTRRGKWTGDFARYCDLNAAGTCNLDGDK